jgi:hypothetical protein
MEDSGSIPDVVNRVFSKHVSDASQFICYNIFHIHIPQSVEFKALSVFLFYAWYRNHNYAVQFLMG